MKKFLVWAIAAVVALSAFAFGCNKRAHEHTFAEEWSSDAQYHWHASTCGHPEAEEKVSHSYNNKSTRQADCTQEGYELYECVCGASHRENVVPAYGHELSVVKIAPSCTEEGSLTYSCSHCDYTRKITLPAEHQYNWNEGEDYFECKTCNDSIPATQGLKFGKIWEKPFSSFFGDHGELLGYSVSKSEVSGDVIIPAYFNDKKVMKIGNYAFQDNADITSVYIPDTISDIGLMAFENCSLTSVIIPDSVEYIGSMAFSGCADLQDVKIYGDVENIDAWAFDDTPISADENHIDNGAFYIDGHLIDASGAEGDFTVRADTLSIASRAFEYSSVTKVNLPRGLKYLSKMAFLECETLEEIKLPEKITEITYQCFIGCTSLKSIYIPVSVRLIDSGALGKCTNLTTINYGGSSEDWAAIDKKEAVGTAFSAWDDGSDGYTVVYAE